MISNLARYQRIARFYDFLDAPFERKRYQPLRPLLFEGLGGALLDAGVGTGRNCAFYPPDATVSGVDTSPAMLAIAQERCPTLAALYEMDVTDLRFPTASFDGAVASFLFCVLPQHQQVTALRELGRVVKPGGIIRLMEYVRPKGTLRRVLSLVWQPWIAWAYGAGFDRETEKHIPKAGLELVESRYVVTDLMKLLTVRVGHSGVHGERPTESETTTIYHLSDVAARPAFVGRASPRASVLTIVALSTLAWLTVIAAVWGLCRLAGR